MIVEAEESEEKNLARRGLGKVVKCGVGSHLVELLVHLMALESP